MKGFIFTATALLLAIPAVVLIASLYEIISIGEKGVIANIQMEETYNVVQTVNKDFERALTITGKHAIIQTINQIINEGEASDNAVEDIEYYMRYSSRNISYYINLLHNTLQRELYYEIINITPVNLDIKPYTSFYIIAEGRINVTLKRGDVKYTGLLPRLGVSKAFIDIEGLEDPIFPLKSDGFLHRTIYKCPCYFHVKNNEGLSNLVLHLRFDEKAAKKLEIFDGTPYENDISIVAGEVKRFKIKDDPCDIDYAAEVNNTQIKVGGGSHLNLNEYTIEFWINTTDNSGTIMRGDNYNITISNGRVVFTVDGNRIEATEINDGFWHHIAVVKRGSNAYIYVDGELERDGSGANIANNNGIIIGEFSGLIDEIRIYNTSLSEEVIIRHSNPDNKKINDLSAFITDITNGYYHVSSEGAGLLDRLEGNLRLSSKYNATAFSGLESFINPEELMLYASGSFETLVAQRINENTTCIDYKFLDWDNNYPGRKLVWISQVFQGFRLSTTDASKYGVENLLYD